MEFWVLDLLRPLFRATWLPYSMVLVNHSWLASLGERGRGEWVGDRGGGGFWQGGIFLYPSHPARRGISISIPSLTPLPTSLLKIKPLYHLHVHRAYLKYILWGLPIVLKLQCEKWLKMFTYERKQLHTENVLYVLKLINSTLGTFKILV